MWTMIKEKLILLTLFLIFSFVTEMLTFHNLGLGFTPKYIILDITLIAFIGSFIFLFKSYKTVLIYLSFFMLIYAVLYLANVTMFKVFGDIFSIEKLLLIQEATQVFEWSFLNAWDILLAIVLFLGYIGISLLIMSLLHFKQDKCTIVPRAKRLRIALIALIFFGLIFEITNLVSSNNINVNGVEFNDEFYVTSLKKSAFKYFGMLSFYYKEVEVGLIDQTYHTDDDNDAYIPEETDFTGLLKGKNVIEIMIESGQEMGINEILTPNLYRLREEGLYFSQNYSVNKTNLSEHIGITGSFPTSNYSLTKPYEVPFSVPKLLDDQYVTSYFHDNNGEFYHRDPLMKNLGFENVYLHDDLFPETLPNWDGHWSWGGNYTLDSIAIEKILPHMINEDEPFYSFWTTLSMHGPYSNNTRSNRDLFISKGYFDKIEAAEKLGVWENPMKGDDYGEFQLKYYQAAVMDLDVAVGRILEELTNKNLLDDTIIILYSDHEVYYHKLHLRLNGLIDNESEDSDENYKMDLLYDTMMYMWNPTLNQAYQDAYGTTKITTFTSPYIVVPTLLDLLGVSYNPDWYLNYSYFSQNYIPAFYSHQLGSSFDNVLYTTDCENIIYEARDDVSEEYKEEFLMNCLKLLQRQSNINDIYVPKE